MAKTTPMSGYGRRIVEARGALSQERLAKMLTRGQSTVNDWEHEKTEPSVRDFILLAEKTGKSAAWLAFGDAATLLPEALDRDVTHKVIAAIERRIGRKPLFRPDPESRARMVIALHDVVKERAPDDLRTLEQIIDDQLDALTKGR